jgi:hypothetical protein
MNFSSMDRKYQIIHWVGLIALLALNCHLTIGHAQGTAFSHQGRLNDGGHPANGLYDLRFGVYDAATNGNVIGSILTNAGTLVANGLFSLTLDFGADVFTGRGRWLELAVRTNGSDAFTALSPRQQVTPAPYAIMANSASNLLGALPATQLSGTVPVSQLPAEVVTNGQAANLVIGGNLTVSNGITAGSFQVSNNGGVTIGTTNGDYATICKGTNNVPWFGQNMTSVTLRSGGTPGLRSYGFYDDASHFASLWYWPDHWNQEPELGLESSGTIAILAGKVQYSLASSWEENFYQFSFWALNMFGNDPDIFQGAAALTFCAMVCTNGDDLVWAGSHAYAGAYSKGNSPQNGYRAYSSTPGWHFRPTQDKGGDGELVFWSRLQNQTTGGPWSGTDPVIKLRAGDQRAVSIYGDVYANDHKGITTNYTVHVGDTLQIQNGIIIGILPYGSTNEVPAK